MQGFFIILFCFNKNCDFQEGNSSFVALYQSRPDGVRRQPLFPADFRFPCPESSRVRSAQRPTSVHRLRPGDVDVVAAMGDSLVAGNGALEEYALGTIIEYRGVSWCAGQFKVYFYLYSYITSGSRRECCRSNQSYKAFLHRVFQTELDYFRNS